MAALERTTTEEPMLRARQPAAKGAEHPGRAPGRLSAHPHRFANTTGRRPPRPITSPRYGGIVVQSRFGFPQALLCLIMSG